MDQRDPSVLYTTLGVPISHPTCVLAALIAITYLPSPSTLPGSSQMPPLTLVTLPGDHKTDRQL